MTRISRDNYAGLREFNLRKFGRGLDDSQSIFHSDGTVSLQIGDETIRQLQELGQNPDIAIERLLAGDVN